MARPALLSLERRIWSSLAMPLLLAGNIYPETTKCGSFPVPDDHLAGEPVTLQTACDPKIFAFRCDSSTAIAFSKRRLAYSRELLERSKPKRASAFVGVPGDCRLGSDFGPVSLQITKSGDLQQRRGITAPQDVQPAPVRTAEQARGELADAKTELAAWKGKFSPYNSENPDQRRHEIRDAIDLVRGLLARIRMLEVELTYLDVRERLVA